MALALVAVAAWVAAAAADGTPQRSGAGPGASDRPGSASAVDRLSGNLIVRHQRVDAAGSPTGPAAPAIVLRLERRRDNGRWRTSLSLKSSEPVWVESLTGRQSLENPFVVARFEYDEDGTPPRLFNRSGKLIPGPTDADRALFRLPDHLRDRAWNPAPILSRLAGVTGPSMDQGPAAGLLVPAVDRAHRRALVERRFGPALDPVRGFDRFVMTSGENTQELLLNPDTALPAELNVVVRGRLATRAQFEYEPIPGGLLIRRRLRAEHATTDANGARLISDVELTDLSLGEGSGR